MDTMNVEKAETARQFLSKFAGATLVMLLFSGCGRKEDLVVTNGGAPLYSFAPESIDGSDGAPQGQLLPGERYEVRGVYSRKDFLVYRVAKSAGPDSKEGFVIFDNRYMAIERKT
ncbi:hypothetical protein [Nevskia ramosa]|uniref:hypothetical protein n=1 Tax=Nevskia ramosa TaxID=64002 RepID=UPI0003B75E72|nr:hypothetical protein [Nevskia ramosa]